jgi:hypothetical protein
MSRALVLTACAIVAGLIWIFSMQAGESTAASPPAPAASAGSTSARADAPPQGAAAVASVPATVTEAPPAVAEARRPEVGAVVGPAPSGSAILTSERIAELGMSRQLAGDHRLEMEGRPHRVLGSKEVTDVDGRSDTLVLLHDELSGQVRYFRSGLQFTLAPGLDAEAFIREHPRQRRLFVNPIYARVEVDVAELATEYTRLQQDERVTSLRFMIYEPVHRLR